MKQISSLELYFLVKEFKDLEGSRVDKIYNSGKEEIYIRLYKSNIGKKILRIIVGKAVFLAGTKSVDETPSGFCLLLRKRLEGKFLDSIAQIEPERILKLVFKSKDETKNLYLEFFGKGNVILCNEDDVIIDCMIHHKFRDRAVIPKEKYKYPNMGYNVFKLQKNKLTELLKNSKKDKIVASLAVELGLGGIYSEEICLLSNIEKNNNPKKINNNEIINILNSIKKIIKNKKNCQIIYKNEEVVDVTPFDLEFYKDYEKKEFPSYNEALDEYFTKEFKIMRKEDSASAKKTNELKRIIGEQEDTLKSLKSKEIENREKAELIYNNYQLIKGVLDEINKASKKYYWEEIKERLKGHKIVKDVDVKEKKVTVET
ncbi:hypothetical protein CMO94_01405 [Candidatus Woesearchaeota archaeon]|jgi:predicted ribosome quality control (RQC) complex YloA/Tae2 family protein|nr:hypothetical protein [Candidatus Woesearchaeota archaeon]